MDQHMDIRNEMMQRLIEVGLNVECQHHEVGTAGQAEIDLRFDEMVKMADYMMMYKYVIKNVAYQHNKTVTFMPKPIFGDNGSGMHTHLSFWKDGKPLFAGDGYAGLSEMALHAIGGILKHAPAILAFTNPTTNSYKRLVPGYEAPVNLAYSQRNRSAACRIPMYSHSPKAKRIEFRCPDPSCNPYLAFSALMMAALDGVQNKIDPGPALDKDIYDLPPEEAANVPKTPGSLDEALEALEADHEFLLRGDVFTKDVVDTWISYKRENEVDPMRLRPHPYEFCFVLRHLDHPPCGGVRDWKLAHLPKSRWVFFVCPANQAALSTGGDASRNARVRRLSCLRNALQPIAVTGRICFSPIIPGLDFVRIQN